MATVTQTSAVNNNKFSFINPTSMGLFLSVFRQSRITVCVLGGEGRLPVLPFRFSGDAQQFSLSDFNERSTLLGVLDQCQGLGFNLYFTPNECGSGIVSGAKTVRTSANVVSLNAVFCDIDGDAAVAARIYGKCVELGVCPSLCIDSGGGSGAGRVHFYWLLSEPVAVSLDVAGVKGSGVGSASVALWKDCQRWFAAFGADATIKDLPRQMRLVGSKNLKRGKMCGFSVDFKGSESVFSLDELGRVLLSDAEYLDVVSGAEDRALGVASALNGLVKGGGGAGASAFDLLGYLDADGVVSEGNRHEVLLAYIRYLLVWRGAVTQGGLVSGCISFIGKYFDAASRGLFLPGGARFASDVVRLVTDCLGYYAKYFAAERASVLAMIEEYIPAALVVEAVEVNVLEKAKNDLEVNQVAEVAELVNVPSERHLIAKMTEKEKKAVLALLSESSVADVLAGAGSGLDELEARVSVADNWCLNVHFLQMRDVVLAECVIIAGRVHVYNGQYYSPIVNLSADAIDEFLRDFVANHKWNWWQSVNKQGGVEVSELGVVTFNHLQFLRKAFAGKVALVGEKSTKEFDTWRDGRRVPYMLGVRNGLLNVDLGVVQPFTEDYVCAGILPFDFDGGAECPVFSRLVRECLCKDADASGKADAADDQKVFKSLAMCMGAAIGENAYRVRKIVLFNGESGSGKSTFLKIFAWLVGLGNCFSLTKDELTKNPRFALSPLPGKKVCLMDEYNLGSMSQNEINMLNGLTAGAPIAVEHKGGAKSEYSGSCLPVITTNYSTEFGRDEGGALMRRLTIFPCKPFKTNIENFEAVIQSEMSGILNFALKGLAALRKGHKIPVSEAAGEEKETMTYNMRDSISEFVDEKFEFDADSPMPIPVARIWELYKEWFNDTGKLEDANAYDKKLVKNLRSFSMKLSKILVKNGAQKGYTETHRFYTGILLKK